MENFLASHILRRFAKWLIEGKHWRKAKSLVHSDAAVVSDSVRAEEPEVDFLRRFKSYLARAPSKVKSGLGPS